MGFKDGTNNLKAEDAKALDRHVWVSASRSRPGCREAAISSRDASGC